MERIGKWHTGTFTREFNSKVKKKVQSIYSRSAHIVANLQDPRYLGSLLSEEEYDRE